MQLATMPLEKLPVISLDLETTGLNTAQDRILQIGLHDPLAPQDACQILVNPTIPIPEVSSAIHGITDSDVIDALAFPQAFRSFRDMLSEKVVIGYNIGFDLAVLSAETERHGIEWRWGSAICLRQLATITLGRDAMLMMGDLDALAAHYNIPTTGRHSALGDALIAAKLYEALIIDLRQQGISTYGEVRRAVGGLDDLRMATTRAGWIDVASQKETHLSSMSFARIDPYPYSHRINEIMMTNPLILPENCLLYEAAAAMHKTRHDCAFVGKAPDAIVGIISERDIVSAMAIPLETVAKAREIPLKDIMSSPVICVREQDYMHVALGRIAHHDIRHLGVEDSSGCLTGWLSTRELIRQRVSDAILIGDELAFAKDGEEMLGALTSLPNLAASLFQEGVSAPDIASVISAEYRAALRRSAILAEDTLTRSHGPPPRPYAVLMLGSGGRDESLLAADQDHAIIYDDKSNPISDDQADDIQKWFQLLGKEISDILAKAGIPYCKGGVMSSSATWCKSLSDWRKAISDWCRKAAPEDLLCVDIFFDFALVYGDDYLGTRLQQAITGRAARRPQFLKSLARSIGSHHGGTSFLGQFKTVDGRFELKRHMLLPLIETIRVLSISRQLAVRNSHERAKALFETKTIPAEILQLSEDIQFCMRVVLRQQIRDISDGMAPITNIQLDGLSKAEQKHLKAIKNRIIRLDQILQDCLF